VFSRFERKSRNDYQFAGYTFSVISLLYLLCKWHHTLSYNVITSGVQAVDGLPQADVGPNFNGI